MGVGTPADAAVSLARIKSAISIAQTGYRSLYWDDGKAALVDGKGGGGASANRELAQAARYQAALDRLATPNTSLGF